MLPQRHAQITFAKQDFPQLRWREKFYPKQRLSFGEQTTPKKIGLAAGCCYDGGWLITPQANSSDLFKPMADHIFPRRFRRAGKMKRNSHVLMRQIPFIRQISPGAVLFSALC